MRRDADFNLDLPPLDDVEIPGIDEYPPNGSVRLHGPPGTGKTTTAAARIARLIRDYDYDVGDIVWCTYRKALAEDTLRRLVYWEVIEPEQLNEPTEGETRFIGTVHAVANRAAGDLPDPVESWNEREFCSHLGIQYKGGPPWTKQVGELLFDTFGWLNKNLYDPADSDDIALADPPALEELRTKWNGSIPRVWRQWEDYKDERGIIDFNEQISAPIERETSLPGKVLVVDEYHDAYPLMAKLCERWMYDAEAVIVAGDPHQVVNDFDGAEPWFFNSLPFPKVLLDTTYRVPEEHWNFAAPVLARSERHDAPDVERISHGEIFHYQNATGAFNHTGKTSTAADIGGWKTPAPNAENGPAKLVIENGRGAKDPEADGVGPDPASVLLLARTKMQVAGIGAALERAGILYTSQQDMRGWDDGAKHITNRRYLFNALQKLHSFDPGNLAIGAGDTSNGLGRFNANDQAQLGGQSDDLRLMPRQAAALLDNSLSKDHAQNRDGTDDIVKDIRNGRHGQRIDAKQLSNWVEPDFWPHYGAGSASVERLKKSTLTDRDRTVLKNALARHAGCSPVSSWENDIGVAVITIHAAKGQEANDVVLYDGITKRIRESMRLDEDSRANEWRTWYVATTRASERLHIVHGGFDWISPLPGHALAPNDGRSERDTSGPAAADGGRQP